MTCDLKNKNDLMYLLPVLSACCLATIQATTFCPEPDHPFRVVWNHPDNCAKFGINLELNKYGIIMNSNGMFIGDQIQTLYRHGRWPIIRGSISYYGGVPQLNADTTFSETRADLSRYQIHGFTGLGVLDWEEWRAIFNTNYGKLSPYRHKSVSVAQHQHPAWGRRDTWKEAEKEWEEGARRVMSGKLAVAQELMPNGHWGYYLYPRTWGSTSTHMQNEKLAWLWKQATGLYPSIYISDPNVDPEIKRGRVIKEVAEALRIRDQFSPPNTVVYPYCNFQQNDFPFFPKSHLEVVIGLPAEMGVDGVILWGSSRYYRRHYSQCLRLGDYVRDVLGPYVQMVTEFMTKCSAALCGGHGRCVHNARDVFVDKEKADSLSVQCTSTDSQFGDYHCRCYNSWAGPCCQHRTPSTCQQQ